MNSWLLLLLICFFQSPSEPVRHSLFIAGPDFTGIIDEDGRSFSMPAVLELAMDSFYRMETC